MFFRIEIHGFKNCSRNFIVGFIFLLVASQPVFPLSPYEDEINSLTARLVDNIAKSGKKTVAVVDFTTLNGDVIELGRFLAEEFSVSLTQKANGFDVIDRTYLKAILQEHKLAASGIIDPLTARRLGQIAGVEAIVTGSITPLGDSVRLSVKVLDTGTAKVIGATTGDIPKTKAVEELLSKNIGGGENQPSRVSESSSPSSVSAGQLDKQIEDNDFLFKLKGCTQSGNTVSCLGSVTNKSSVRRQLYLDPRSSDILDDLGNQYQYGTIQLGAQGTQQWMEPELLMNFSVGAKQINPEAKFLNIVLGYGFFQQTPWRNEGYLKVTFRGIPIQRR